MPRPRALSTDEVAALCATFSDWALADDGSALSRSFRFADFSAAFGFMTRVALVAERLDHHPDWNNSYGRVDITVTTHDVGALTRLDAELVAAIDAL